MNRQSCEISILDWDDAKSWVQPVRESVFIQEQHVPEELEWDDYDQDARHAVAKLDDERIIGCGRLLPMGHIGRMAVLKRFRRQGFGSAILGALETEADRLNYSKIILHAQLQAIPFYIQHGYQADGAIFDEAGIPHQKCIKYL